MDAGEVAEAAYLDGTEDPATLQLSCIGHSSGNAARGFRRFVAREKLLDGLWIDYYTAASKINGVHQDVEIP